MVRGFLPLASGQQGSPGGKRAVTLLQALASQSKGTQSAWRSEVPGRWQKACRGNRSIKQLPRGIKNSEAWRRVSGMGTYSTP